jgi:hypothetical protein
MFARRMRSVALSVGLIGWLGCSTSPGPGGTGSGASGTGGSTTGTAGNTGGGGPGTAGTGTAGAGQAGASGGGSGAAGAATSGTAGGSGTAGASGSGAAGSTGGSVGAAGAGTAGAGAAGSGAAGAGTAGTTGAAGGLEPGDTPPWRALNVTAAPGLHAHGQNAAMDNRATPLGKMAVNLGVSGGGFSSWLVKRGYHGVGASFGECNAPNLGAGRDAVGTCRMGEWKMISDQVTATVKGLATSAATEDWGYFLTQDGASVRWSDVAFVGVSHGATTAAIIGRIGTRVWRAVSCAPPRDNTCGKGPFSLPYDPAHPPFDVPCADANVASWLDKPSLTPMNRFFMIDGVGDGEYGDIMFNVERTMYPGQPVQFDAPGAVLTGTNRFIAMGGGHLDFLNAADSVKPPNTDAVLNIAFAIPPANQNPKF